MAHKRALKPKTVERLRVLNAKHPGELSVDEQAELEKLTELSEKYGNL